MKLIKSEDLHIAQWAGGTTCQLGIYPYDGDYKLRRFKWRISTAVVDVEESTFTNLPGINRLLMVLEGELKLIHEGHHSCVLKQYEMDRFLGDWNTKSYGKVRDFNLMINGDGKGSLEAIVLGEGEHFKKYLETSTYKNIHHLIYVTKGIAKIGNLEVKAQDSLLIEDPVNELIIENNKSKEIELVISTIEFN